MNRQFTQSLLLVTLLAGRVHAARTDVTTLPLAGTWNFRLDGEDVGVAEKWFALELDDTVQLPGTTGANHKVIKKDEQAVDRLSRIWYWKGPAWYQRRVTIPHAWHGKRITLLLERSKNTRVWVDQTSCGGEDTLSAPQCFDVTAAKTPGEHTLNRARRQRQAAACRSIPCSGRTDPDELEWHRRQDGTPRHRPGMAG